MTDDPWAQFPEAKDDPWAQFPEAPAAQDKPLWQRATDPLRYGAAETLRGDASTLKLAAGKDSNAAHLLEGGANLVAPQDYEPAGNAMQKAWDQGKYLAWASNLPKRVGESLPQLGQAVAGGAIAGPFGFGAGYLGSTVGPDANIAASARTGDMGAEPNTGDIARAVASGAANALIQRATLGLAKGVPVSVASSAGVRAAAGQVAKGAAAEAAGSGAGSIAHQAIVEQKLPDVQETLADTATGGLLGAGIRAAKVPADAVNSVKASRAGLTGEEGQRIADRLAPEDMSTPTKAFAAVKKVETDLKAQFSANKPKGQPDAVDEVINRTKSTLDQGGQVDPSDLMSLKSTFGANDPFVNAIEDHSSLNQVKTLGNFDTGGETFAGGITGSPFGKLALNPLGKYGRMGEVGNFAAHALGFHVPGIGHALGALSPETGLAIAVGHTGLYGAAHAGDRLLGLRNPGQEFVNRFASPEGQGFDPSQLPPSYNDQQSSQAAQVAAANDKLKSLGKTAAIMQRSQAMEQAQANAPLAEAKRTSQLMTNSDALAAKQANDALKSPAFTSKMMTADAANQAKAQALLEKTVNDAETAKQRNVNQALGNAKQTAGIMRNSDPAKTSAGDATMPLRVARLKQQFAAQAERDSEAAIKQQVSEKRAQQREETKAGLQSLLEGDNAEAKFQARVAELGAKRKPPVDPTKYTNIDPREYNSLLGKSAPVNNNRTPGYQKALDEHDSIMARWDAAHNAAKDAERVLGRGMGSEFELVQARKKLNDAHREIAQLEPRMREPDPNYEPTIPENGGLQNVLPQRIDGHFSSEGPQGAANDGPKNADPRQRIEDAYTAATGGKYSENVSLDKIRAALPDLDRATVDAALKKILGSESEKATLGRNDDPRRISPAQKDAAFNPYGEPFHLLSISGPKAKAKPEPEVTEMPPHPVMRVKEGGHTVDRTTAGVLKAARYAESIRGRMAAKNDAINASIAENPAHATALTSLLTELHTSNARSRNGAEAVIQRHLQNLPPKVQASVRAHLTEKFWNSWRKIND